MITAFHHAEVVAAFDNRKQDDDIVFSKVRVIKRNRRFRDSVAKSKIYSKEAM